MNNDKDNATLYAELKAERFMTDQISLLHEAEDLADGINFMLKSIGEFTDADRAYVFETSENHTSTNTYECAPQESPRRSGICMIFLLKACQNGSRFFFMVKIF